MACPPATQNISLNLKNRQVCIDKARYGPLTPELANVKFWKDKANMWDVSVEEAKKARCANCSAFIQTPAMLACIEKGIGDEKGSFSIQVRKSANLGYCELFDFKCAGDRTCDAWITGGPIKSSKLKI